MSNELPDFPEENEASIVSALKPESTPEAIINFLVTRGYRKLENAHLKSLWRKGLGYDCAAMVAITDEGKVSVYRKLADGQVRHVGLALYDPTFEAFARNVSKAEKLDESTDLPEFSASEDEQTVTSGLSDKSSEGALSARGYVRYSDEDDDKFASRWVKRFGNNRSIRVSLRLDGTCAIVTLDGDTITHALSAFAHTPGKIRAMLNYEEKFIERVDESTDLPDFPENDGLNLSSEPVTVVEILNARGYSKAADNVWVKDLAHGISVWVYFKDSFTASVSRRRPKTGVSYFATVDVSAPSRLLDHLNQAEKLNESEELPEFSAEEDAQSVALDSEGDVYEVILKLEGFEQGISTSPHTTLWSNQYSANYRIVVKMYEDGGYHLHMFAYGSCCYNNTIPRAESPAIFKARIKQLKHEADTDHYNIGITAGSMLGMNESEELPEMPEDADQETLSRLANEQVPYKDELEREQVFIDIAVKEFDYEVKSLTMSVVLDKVWKTNTAAGYSTVLRFMRKGIVIRGASDAGLNPQQIPYDVPTFRYKLGQLDKQVAQMMADNNERPVCVGGVAPQLKAINTWLEDNDYNLLMNEETDKDVYQHWAKKLADNRILEFEVKVSDGNAWFRNRYPDQTVRCRLDIEAVKAFVSKWERGTTVNESEELAEFPEDTITPEYVSSTKTPKEVWYGAKGKRLTDHDKVILSTSAQCAFWYAKHRLKGRFVLGEPAIAKNAEYAYAYAKDILRGAFKLGEPAIAKSNYAYAYAVYILKQRFPLGEPAIKDKEELWKAYCRIFELKESAELAEFPEEEDVKSIDSNVGTHRLLADLMQSYGYSLNPRVGDWRKKNALGDFNVFFSMGKAVCYMHRAVTGVRDYSGGIDDVQPHTVEKMLKNMERAAMGAPVNEDEQQEFPLNYADMPQPGAGLDVPDLLAGAETLDRRIKISFARYTPESIENGEAEETGWEDEEGVEFDEDFYESYADGIRAVVRFLQNKGVSDNGGADSGTYSSPEMYVLDYGTGEMEEISCHLDNFTEKEMHDIHEIMRGRMSVRDLEPE